MWHSLTRIDLRRKRTPTAARGTDTFNRTHATSKDIWGRFNGLTKATPAISHTFLITNIHALIIAAGGATWAIAKGSHTRGGGCLGALIGRVLASAARLTKGRDPAWR